MNYFLHIYNKKLRMDCGYLTLAEFAIWYDHESPKKEHENWFKKYSNGQLKFEDSKIVSVCQNR